MEIDKNSCSSIDARDDHACGFKCNICLEVAYQDPIVTPCGHLYCWPCLHRWLRVCLSQSNKLHCPACTAVIKEKKMIPIYGIQSDRRSPSVRRGIKFPNSPSKFSSSLIGRAVCQTLNAIASAFKAPFSSSSIGRAVPQTLEAIASALDANHFSKVFEFMPMVLGGIGVIVLGGGYFWWLSKPLVSTKQVLNSVEQVHDSWKICDGKRLVCGGWKKVKAICSLGFRVFYYVI